MKYLHQTIQNWFLLKKTDSQPQVVIKNFILFGYLQAVSCIFPVLIFLLLAVSMPLSKVGVPRYDLLFLACIVVQVIMYKTGVETKDEVYVITMFHFLGLVMEIHKVYHGSWSYPESAYTKFWGVPLYSGFMYASVGSYICQAWRNLQIGTTGWPSVRAASLLGAAIYLNFFTNAFIPDLRLYISVLLVIIFWKARFTFVLNQTQFRMSALLSFTIIGFFIWLAENVATFFGAWKYAYQHAGWKMVSWHKITSWGLLVIVSIIIVAELKRFKARRLVEKT